MKEMPLPFTVWAMRAVGRPFVAFAPAKAACNAARSWPSTLITCQPKARNFSSSGSTFMMSFVRPSSCTPLSSTMAQTLSSPKCAAVMAASQTWPSWTSPSPMRQ